MVEPDPAPAPRARPGARLWLCTAVALIGGAAAGVIDLSAVEVQPTVLLVVLFSGLLGLARPGAAWLWALLVGGAIPVAHWVGPALGVQPPYAVAPNRWATLLALIPAFVAAYAGAVVGWIVSRVRRGR